ncbi:hypothetical protein Y032_0002g725 [Ancylostoma ceylanicum]|uniref:Uncharacterized protein n=1 Tax=Ancylostoma ceylanicum TaxID=53326 RepID=A0A016W153_9BILA|nr:hypothetical protein Y032_0002g725 [Ancylostoma ceylanicum]
MRPQGSGKPTAAIFSRNVFCVSPVSFHHRIRGSRTALVCFGKAMHTSATTGRCCPAISSPGMVFTSLTVFRNCLLTRMWSISLCRPPLQYVIF